MQHSCPNNRNKRAVVKVCCGSDEQSRWGRELLVVFILTFYQIVVYFKSIRVTRIHIALIASPSSGEANDCQIYTPIVLNSDSESSSIQTDRFGSVPVCSVKQGHQKCSSSKGGISHGLDYDIKGARKPRSLPFLFFGLLLCYLQSCDSVGSVQANPLTLKPRSLGSAHGAPLWTRSRKVLLPPQRLGFHGQTQGDVPKHEQDHEYNLAQNYQCDESSNNQRLPSQVFQNEQYSNGQKKRAFPEDRFRYKSGTGTLNLYGRIQSRNAQSKPQYREYKRRSEIPWNSVGPIGAYPVSNPPTFMSANGYHSNKNYGRIYYDYAPPQRSEREDNRFNKAMRQYLDSRAIEQLPHRFNDYDSVRDVPYPDSRAWYQPYNQLDTNRNQDSVSLWDRQSSILEAAPAEYHGSKVISVGHPSNYDELSEEEVSRKVHEYNDPGNTDQLVHIPALPPISFTMLNETSESENRIGDDQGLKLNGSAALDRLVKNFHRSASHCPLIGVEKLFEEIDTNGDGVIKIDELKNFLCLHEVTAPD